MRWLLKVIDWQKSIVSFLYLNIRCSCACFKLENRRPSTL